jgi:endonuclease/exonuclease/phosphatase family metal-dependent hydrolase
MEHVMTRVLSYNILAGATRRVDQLTRIISSVQPDVVGLVEAINPRVVEELAKRLGMQYVMSGCAGHSRDWQVAALSRLPILHSEVHLHPEVLTRPVLEVSIEEPDGQPLTVFVTHLSAAFNQGRAGDHIRRREVRLLLRLMAPRRGTPHLLMGDFNALAPGDPFRAHALLGYIVAIDQRYRANPLSIEGHPHLDFVVPPGLRIFNPLLRLIPRSKLLSLLFDKAASWYAPRGSIALLRSAGYIDCYRRVNPLSQGFTCPSAAPAGRIDFIFASPELAERLATSTIVTEGNGLPGEEASDHLPVFAEYGPILDVKLSEQQSAQSVKA